MPLILTPIVQVIILVSMWSPVISPLCRLFCLSVRLSVCLSVILSTVKTSGKKIIKTNLRKGIDLGLCIRRGAALHPCIRLCFRYQIFYFDFFVFEDHDVIRR